jgi:hypothetical protein
MTRDRQRKLREALEALAALGFPRAQRNDRSAICLLALLDLTPSRAWKDAQSPCIGIRGVLDFARNEYKVQYAENTRESLRRQTMHQFLQAQLALYNPDDPARPVNSPKAVYQIAPAALELLRDFGTRQWGEKLARYLVTYTPLAGKFGKEREMVKVPVTLAEGKQVRLSPGEHSELIKAIIEQFAPRFMSGGRLIYAGDTGEKWGYFDTALAKALGIKFDSHGKMPDVLVHDKKRKWLFLIEAFTSHGPVDSKRHHELRELFAKCKAGLVYVTAFPNRATMKRYLADIAWETEVWVADAPSHLIHFDGERFLGPY